MHQIESVLGLSEVANYKTITTICVRALKGLQSVSSIFPQAGDFSGKKAGPYKELSCVNANKNTMIMKNMIKKAPNSWGCKYKPMLALPADALSNVPALFIFKLIITIQSYKSNKTYISHALGWEKYSLLI